MTSSWPSTPSRTRSPNPQDMGPFVRMDWLEDLDMEVPTTYDELTAVLEAFKTEKNCAEPMSLYNTVSMNDGLLMAALAPWQSCPPTASAAMPSTAIIRRTAM